jgi:hypothetical protein
MSKGKADPKASRRSLRGAPKSDGNSKSERTYGVPYDVEENEPGIAK